MKGVLGNEGALPLCRCRRFALERGETSQSPFLDGAHSRAAQRAASTARLTLRGAAPPRESLPSMDAATKSFRDWRIPTAWLTLCVVWSSTWLVIKIGLRDLPPVSFVALRFVVAILVLLAISIGRARLLPRSRADYLVLGRHRLADVRSQLHAPFLGGAARLVRTGGSHPGVDSDLRHDLRALDVAR